MISSSGQNFTYSGKDSRCPGCGDIKTPSCYWDTENLFCFRNVHGKLGVDGYSFASTMPDGRHGHFIKKKSFSVAQAEAHLAALGYVKGKDKIFLRFIDPAKKRLPIKGKGELNLNAKQIEQYQSQGYDVYFVANGQANADEGVQVGRAIFFEHDDLDKSLQRDLWQSLRLPEPTIQIDTGGKSIHSYWVFDQPINIDDWCKIQSDLLEYSDGDRTIRNPSRILRLAGAAYMKSAKPGTTRATIISNSGLRYSYNELREVIPVAASATTPTPALIYQPSSTDAVPLYQCLSKDDRALIDGGSGTGSRNADGAKLARNLIGTATRLQHLGHRFDGDPRQLYDTYCNNCTPGDGWNQREQDTIWQSAEGDNPTATLTDDAIENCIKAWQRNQSKANQRVLTAVQSKSSSNSSNVIIHPTAERLTMDDDDIAKAIDNLIAQGLTASKLQLAIATLAKDALRSQQTIAEAYRLRLVEIEQAEARDETAKDLEKLVNAANYSVDINEILPAQLAKPISQLSAWLNLNPLAYLTTLLTTASSLNKVGTFVEVSEAVDWTEPPQLYAGIVAVSSQKKSPILKAMASKPLARLQRQINENFRAEMEEYTGLMNLWNSLKGEERTANFPDGEPVKPKLRRLNFSAGTTEGLFRQMQGNPEMGILWNCDELASLFKGANQYKGGKGDDIEALLSMYDGAPITILRSDESKNIDLIGCILSIMGAIQPTVLHRLMQDDIDGNGQWARFCWVTQQLAKASIPLSGKIDMTPLLADFYGKVDALQPTVYKLTLEARRKFLREYDRLEDKRIESAAKSSGLSSCYGKAEGRLARLALNLHILWELSEGKTPGEFISVEIMKKAIALNRFYLAQVVGMYSEFHGEDSIAPHLMKVLEVARSKDWVKVKDVQLKITPKHRPKPDTVRLWFSELVAMGLGSTQGQGRSIEFSAKVDAKVDESRQKVDKSSTAETIDIIGFESKVDKVDKVDDFPKNQISEATSNVDEPQEVVEMEVQPPPTPKVDEPEETPLFKETSTLSTFTQDADVVDVSAVDDLVDAPSTFEEPSTFDVGDEVQIVDGKHIGKRGTIREIDEADPLKTYRIRESKSRWTAWFPASALSHIVSSDRSSISTELKIGDYVEILVGTDRGQRATVTGFTDLQIEVKIPGDSETYAYFVDQLKKV